MMILLDLDLADRRILEDLESCRHDHLDADRENGDFHNTLAVLRRHETRFASVYSSLVRQAIRNGSGGILGAAMQTLTLDELRSAVATREARGDV